MAKTCSICNRSYPDQLPACPYCEPATVRPGQDPLDDPFSVGDEDAATVRPTSKKPVHPEEEIVEVGDVGRAEVTDVASDVLSVEEVVAAEPTSTRSDVLNVGEAAVVESPSGQSDVLEIEEAAVAEPGSPMSDVIEVGEVEVVAGPTSAKSDVIEVSESPVESPAGQSDVLDIEEAAVVVGPASAKSDVLEVSAEPPPPKSDTLEIDAAQVLDEPASAKSDVIDVSEAAVVESPSGKSDILEIDEAEVVVEPSSIIEAAEAVEVVDEAEPKQAPPQAKPDPKATRMAGRAPAPTMLAGEDAFDEGATVPPGMPNLELDSGKGKKSDEVVEVGEEVLEAAEASAVEEVVEEDLIEAEEALEPDEALEQTISFEPPSKESGKDASALDILAEDVVEEPSGADLQRKAPAKPDRTSGVDMIAEALESGVDLGSDAPKPPPTKPTKRQRKSEVDLEGVYEPSSESSAVDLGATERPSSKKKAGEDEVEEVVEAAEEEGVVEVSEEVVEEAVEDELPQVKSKKGKADEEAVEESLLAEGEEAAVEEAVAEAAEEEVVTPKTKAKEKTKKDEEADYEPEEDEYDRKRGRKGAPVIIRGGGFFKTMVSILFGMVLVAGAAVAVWYMAPDLLENIPESPRGKDFKWQKVDKEKHKAVEKELAAAKALAEARRKLDRGEFDAAIKLLAGAVSIEEKGTRGEARWRKYLQEKQGEALKADDELVKEAREDLAGNDYFLKQIDDTLKADQETRSAQAIDKAVRNALAKIGQLPKGDNAAVAKAVEGVIQRAADDRDLLENLNKTLVDNNLLKKGDPIKGVPFKDLVESLAAARDALEEASKQLKVKPREVPKTVMELDATRKALDEKLTEVNARLKAAGVKDGDEKGVKELADARDALLAQKKALDGAVEQALAELKQSGVVLQGDDPKKQLVEGSRTIRLKAESPLASGLGSMFSSLSGLGGGAGKLLQRGFDATSQSTQLAVAKAREALLETPEQRLDTQIALAQGGRKDPRDLVSASKYVEWVNSKESKAPPEMKAKALYALGLAQRNVGQYAEAVKSLKQAVDAVAALKTPPAWAGEAKEGLKELTDSTVYFLPRAKRLAQEGKLPQALEELNTGLKAMPNDPQLLAQRGLVRLEMVQPPAKLDAGTQKQVRDDATLVQKDPRHAAEGYYLLGRLEEQAGNLPQAEQNYTQAIKMNQGGPEETERYKAALGNLLLRDRPAADAEPAPKGKAPVDTSGLRIEDRGSRIEDRTDLAQFSILDPPSSILKNPAQLVDLLVTGVQLPDEDDNPEQAARLKQAIKLAEDLIKSDNPKTKGEGYMILGQVYAKQGKRTAGLFNYVKGLELFYPGKKTEELVKMVNEHPAFQQPDSLAKADQRQAERHFGKGLDAYWAGRYPLAEEQFRQAVINYDQDARYQYFLGLARYAQDTKAKREAAVQAWREGARLEAARRPHTIYVNASMERVQGEVRQILNNYRQKTP